jgi:hypothetical protein
MVVLVYKNTHLADQLHSTTVSRSWRKYVLVSNDNSRLGVCGVLRSLSTATVGTIVFQITHLTRRVDSAYHQRSQ